MGTFTAGDRRLVVYVVYDRDGVIDDFVPYALAAVREHSSAVLVVANGHVDERGRRILKGAADTVLYRENIGFDIWAYKHAIDFLGAEVEAYDELILANDTWYGPVRPFGPVFARMDATDVDLWGMTENAGGDPFPGLDGGTPRHLQSFWTAVRRPVLESPTWRDYWRNLPEMPGYLDAVLRHELRFTALFEEAGFRTAAAFPADDYPTGNASILLADKLVADGCPLLKRRLFHHYPPYFHRYAVIGRWTLREVANGGSYPLPLIYQNLARTVSPRVLNADAGLLEVLPDVDVAFDDQRPPRVLVVARVDESSALEPLLTSVDALPMSADLVVATADASAGNWRALLGRTRTDVRVVDTTTTLAEIVVRSCGTLIADEGDDRYDLVVALEGSVPSRRDPEYNTKEYRRLHALDSVLGSPGHAANVLALFQLEPTLGIVLPPSPHIGATGQPERVDRGVLEAARQSIGIRVPLDDTFPLLPTGGAWIARPEALRLLCGGDERAEPRAGGGVLDALLVSAAAQLGFHHRTVLDPRQAAISHTSLEYKVDRLGSTTWGYPLEQLQMLQKIGLTRGTSGRALAGKYARMRHPRVTERLLRLLRLLSSIRRGSR